MSSTALRVTGLAGILAASSLRAMISVQPQVIFDVDPARDALPMLAIGPVGSGILDLILLASAALALVGEWRAGHGVRALPLALAALGSVAVFIHGLGNSVDAFRGGTWMAAMFAVVALAHLFRERRLRVVAAAVLFAATVPLVARGAVQVTREHAATVAQYDASREVFLAERGWEPDSSAARSYERRLRQPEATGWFALSNPFSSLMGIGFVGLGALAIVGWRRGLAAPASLVGLAALGAGALLLVNGGKGAIAATGLGATCVVLIARGTLAPRAGLPLAFSAVAILLVIARGLIGPSIGELSVLFRAFYLEAGARILAANPLLGIGPDALQPAFMVAKAANCPEDVVSLHSIFADWLVAYGLFGASWALALACMMRGVLRIPVGDDRAQPALPGALFEAGASPLALRVAGAIAVAALVLQSQIEAPALDQQALVLRAIGLAAFVVVAACAARIAEELSEREFAATAIGVAVLALVHAQIEMSAWLAGSVAIVLAVIALGSSLRPGGAGGRVAMALAVLPLAAAALPAISVLRERSLHTELERAASDVRPLVEVRAAFIELASARGRGEADDGARLVDAVEATGDGEAAQAVAAALRADDAEAVKRALVALDGRLRRAASEILSRAAAAHPESRVPREAAIKQLAASGRRTTGSRATRIVDSAAHTEAMRLAAEWAASEPGQRPFSLASDLAVESLIDATIDATIDAKIDAKIDAIRSGDDVAVRRAAEDAVMWAERALEAQPRSTRRLVDYGDALSALGRSRDAVDAYEAALAQDDRLALDPLMQFSTRERNRVREGLERNRIKAEAPAPPPTPPSPNPAP
jgi:tetratricopeptide (TPR) repeat protein